jgi:hypothetical protein
MKVFASFFKKKRFLALFHTLKPLQSRKRFFFEKKKKLLSTRAILVRPIALKPRAS